jgi:hypothetical protein
MLFFYMQEHLAHCGLDCSRCDAYVARKKDDQRLRETAANEWEVLYGHKGLRPEDIDCDGCLTLGGKIFPYCRFCAIRNCALERKVAHCIECEEFECDKLKRFLGNHPDAKKNLDDLKK